MKKTKSKESSFDRIARYAMEKRADGSSSSPSTCCAGRGYTTVSIVGEDDEGNAIDIHCRISSGTITENGHCRFIEHAEVKHER